MPKCFQKRSKHFPNGAILNRYEAIKLLERHLYLEFTAISDMKKIQIFQRENVKLKELCVEFTGMPPS